MSGSCKRVADDLSKSFRARAQACWKAAAEYWMMDYEGVTLSRVSIIPQRAVWMLKSVGNWRPERGGRPSCAERGQSKRKKENTKREREEEKGGCWLPTSLCFPSSFPSQFVLVLTDRQCTYAACKKLLVALSAHLTIKHTWLLIFDPLLTSVSFPEH